MSRNLKFVLFALGFLVATGYEAARADEGFVCPGGKIVYVPFGKLDEMKRTNACVASYFGAGSPPVAAASEPAAQPVPARALAPATLEQAAPAPVRLKTIHDADATPERAAASRRVAAVRVPPRAAEGTDYRNITVLNAGESRPQVYQHLD